MAVTVTHAKVSAKVGGGDTSVIQPVDWNAVHVLNCATGVALGRAAAGAGPVEEFPWTALGRSILAATDFAALSALGLSLPTTGDVKFTIKKVADVSWVMCNDGTVGNAVSGATTRAHADTWPLFELLWDIDAAYTPIFNSDGAASTRGATAATDFAANKRIALTKMLGCVLGVAGAGAGLTVRALGVKLGEETHQLLAGELPAHTHTVVVTDLGHTHTEIKNNATGADWTGGDASGNVEMLNPIAGNTGSSVTNISVAVNDSTQVRGAPLNVIQPTSFLNAMIKL